MQSDIFENAFHFQPIITSAQYSAIRIQRMICGMIEATKTALSPSLLRLREREEALVRGEKARPQSFL